MLSPQLMFLFSFTECKVVDSTNTHELYVMHSFEDDSVCFDRTRLNVIQTEFSPNASFTMRTFRFNVGGSATESQQQTVMCSLHLDAVTEISQNQASDCSCYTQTECEQRSHLRGLYLGYKRCENYAFRPISCVSKWKSSMDGR